MNLLSRMFAKKAKPSVMAANVLRGVGFNV